MGGPLAASWQDPACTGEGGCCGDGGQAGPGPGGPSAGQGSRAGSQVCTPMARYGRGCDLAGRRGVKRTRPVGTGTDFGPPLCRPVCLPLAPCGFLNVSVISHPPPSPDRGTAAAPVLRLVTCHLLMAPYCSRIKSKSARRVRQMARLARALRSALSPSLLPGD